MLGTIYIRSIIAIAGICGMMCYLQTTEALTEAIAGIVAVVYLDKMVSGSESD